MKKIVLSFILITFVIFASSGVHAQRYELGADVAVKVDYFRFMDSTLGDLDLQNGVYVGIEAYKQLLCPNLYLGAEVGWAGTDASAGVWRNELLLNSVDLDVTYVPIEFNAKYVIPIQPCLKLDLGAGLSLNYFKLSVDSSQLGLGSGSDSDWAFGGQFFTALNYTFSNNLFLGVEAKYQLTQNLTIRGLPSDVSADNLRIGGQFGYKF
jgi:hypothetical protein